ncbi:MAG: ribonuclease III [Chloroflexi bacterium]|nr:ribonuclease III [Chloroflexota bacterium]
MKDINNFEDTLGIRFQNKKLLARALSHSSYANEKGSVDAFSNERLEFLGDAVLGIIVAERIYRDHPENQEGSLTRMRVSVVRGDTLVKVARSLNIGEYLRLGKGEAKSGGSNKPANLAGALEAIIGAIYLDCGLLCVRDFVEKHFAKYIEMAWRASINIDSKTRLQEYFQAKGRGIPQYRLVNSHGPDHKKHFVAEVLLNDIVLACGHGLNKKEAQEAAASAYLKSMDNQQQKS